MNKDNQGEIEIIEAGHSSSEVKMAVNELIWRYACSDATMRKMEGVACKVFELLQTIVKLEE